MGDLISSETIDYLLLFAFVLSILAALLNDEIALIFLTCTLFFGSIYILSLFFVYDLLLEWNELAALALCD